LITALKRFAQTRAFKLERAKKTKIQVVKKME